MNKIVFLKIKSDCQNKYENALLVEVYHSVEVNLAKLKYMCALTLSRF